LEIEKSIWEEKVGKNASAKGPGLCDRVKRGVCAKKEKGVFIVEGKERGGTGICGGPTKKRVYLTFQVTPNFTSTFCSKKGQKTKDGTGLLTHKPVDNKKWVSPPTYNRYIEWSGKEKSIYEARPKIRIQQRQD